jgi:hypothetical protein
VVVVVVGGVVHFCKELIAPATIGDDSYDSMGNFMRKRASIQTLSYVPHENSVARF